MDNTCIFYSYKVKGEPKFTKTSAGKSLIQFFASSIRPNKAGLWNKNSFSAFGEAAEHLSKLVQQGTILDIVAEQQAYEKGNEILQNYLIKDFTIKKDRKPKESGEEVSEEAETAPEVIEETAEEEPSEEKHSDYDEMMKEFM